jgi:elongator complex protein 3
MEKLNFYTTFNNEPLMDFYQDILELVLNSDLKTKSEIHNKKIELCRKYNLPRVPSDADILEHAPEEIYEIVEPILRTKPMRTISGVAPVAVMTSPVKCPHGTCGYCPGGVEYGSAQSYTGFEPAALRAGNFDFNPYLQTKSRLEQLAAIGHHTDKIDLIIMGGTFTAREDEYQEWFIKGCFAAMNAKPHFDELTVLDEYKLQNEDAPHRCTGLTIETRPDWCKEPQVDKILALGGTRVELGVQTVYDNVLCDVNRGHTVQDSVEATRILKDAGLKVCYHMMPGLPGVDFDADREMFSRLFNEQEFMPDMLKIYPTLVVKGTELYQRWKDKSYEPLDTAHAVELIAEFKQKLPPWVRIQRIQRDIPVQYIERGVDKSNLRQLVKQKLDETGKKCNCIRCREVGHRMLEGAAPEPENIELRTIEYKASDGSEVFMSYEDQKNDLLIAFVRLRLPSASAHRPDFYGNFAHTNNPEKSPDRAIIRELKVFGPMATLEDDKEVQRDTVNNLDKKKTRPWQHLGYGRLLVEAAEKYTSEHWGVKRILVMSGVGVKQYYKRLGYEKEGPYMMKSL